MKPCSFEYFDPESVEEAIGLLKRHGEEAKILAGGQSLVPMMNFRVARPKVLIDINRIKGMDGITAEGDELIIGALARERDVERSPLVRQKCPILAEAISHIGHIPIRTRGTIGGSMVHADPSAEIPTVIAALDARMKVVGPSGERLIEPGEFFVTYLTTSLDPDELLIEIRIKALQQNTGWSFLELSRRQGDFAIVAVAALLDMDEFGTCKEARVCLGGVAATPLRAVEAEEMLKGRVPDESLIDEAARAASDMTEPESDYHASSEYRREMARVFVQRGLKEAVKRAKGGA